MTALYDPDLRRETPLAAKLKARIRRDGPISVRDYMAACLADPEHGYYVARDPIGRAGDFITAPEISQIFGELIGLWSAVVWQQMGSPPRLALIELGPGRGTLMVDALRATRRVPGFHAALSVHLVETNERLRASQLSRLTGSGVPMTWHTQAREFALDTPSIVIGNEFLDTCPVDQALEVGTQHLRRGVDLDAEGRLQFVPLSHDGTRAGQNAGRERDARDGAIVETQDFTVLDQLRAALGQHHVAMLFVDYGHIGPSTGDTLQAVRGHESEHPLTSPGEADLTVQVSFSQIADMARRATTAAPGLAVDGPVSQAEFLGRLGIIERASKLMSANPEKAAAVESGVLRLLAPQGMGGRFKAVGLRSADLPPLPGFAE
ncbi:MAG: SAM-dependent methyltransferase [Hyphomicrobium sp.]|nr:SAM-dependent methyltransferase [Hyphomicrobium sp.]